MGQVRAGAIAENPSLALVAVCDPTPPVAPPPSCLLVSDYESLLALDLDAVFVATPNAFAPRIVIDALDLGRHVFCEKPPGRTVDDVVWIREAEARNRGRKLQFGFNHRYHSAVQEAKALVDGGRYGDVLWMRGVYGKSGGRDFERSWRNDKDLSGGGVLLDQGIHMIDLFRLFAGDFTDVCSFVNRAFWNIELEDNAFALLRNARSQVAMLHSSATHWKHRFSLEIFLSAGYIVINGILSQTRSYGRETLIVARRQQAEEGTGLGNPREETTYFDRDVSWALEVEDFVKCIQQDLPVTTGSSSGALAAMQLVHKIYDADPTWRQGRCDDLQPTALRPPAARQP